MPRASHVTIVLALSTLSVAAPAMAKDAYNGDIPIYRCSGNDEFDQYGNHWIRSGEDPNHSVRNTGAGTFAAIHWTTEWPGEGETLTGLEHHAEVVPPRGTRLPVNGVLQAASEVIACWVLQPLEKDAERPEKIRDARKPLEVTCRNLPAHLQIDLPILVDTGNVLIDVRKGVMKFFGVELRLVPHTGSAYVGINKDFAVSIHKRYGGFRITLPQGRILEGSCGFLPGDS